MKNLLTIGCTVRSEKFYSRIVSFSGLNIMNFISLPKTQTNGCFAPPGFGSSFETFLEGFGRGIGTVS